MMTLKFQKKFYLAKEMERGEYLNKLYKNLRTTGLPFQVGSITVTIDAGSYFGNTRVDTGYISIE